ncbi:hypothetical protein [Selenomonas sp. AB3002]|uniref:hypothetical protein n=1 Tax=Selenomonas sp. AB3002 TaxID=1392502 RepID=UPI0004959309
MSRERQVLENNLRLARRNITDMLCRIEDMGEKELLDTMRTYQIINSVLTLHSLAECTDGEPEVRRDAAKIVLGIYNEETNKMVKRYVEEFDLGVSLNIPASFMFGIGTM